VQQAFQRLRLRRAGSWAEGQNPVVLYAEPNFMRAQMIAQMLRSEDADVEIALNSEAAIAHAMRRRFDLMILETGLPPLGACETARRIAALDRRSSLAPILHETDETQIAVFEEADQTARPPLLFPAGALLCHAAAGEDCRPGLQAARH